MPALVSGCTNVCLARLMAVVPAVFYSSFKIPLCFHLAVYFYNIGNYWDVKKKVPIYYIYVG